MIFKAIGISKVVIDKLLLANQNQVVLLRGKSYFESGIVANLAFLEKDGDVFISTHKKGLLPNQIIVSPEDFNVLINMDYFHIDLMSAYRFSLKQHKPIYPKQLYAKDINWLSNIIDYKQLGLNINDISNHESAFFTYNNYPIDNKYEKDIMWFIGRGPGSTPSGDDMLIGSLCLQYMIMGEESSLYKALSKIKFSKKTTPISIRYYKFALQGYFSSRLIQVVRALILRRERQVLLRYINQLKIVGAHSGIDSLYGVYLSIINLYKYKLLGVKL